MALIREGKPSISATVTWSDGTMFSGFALCGLKAMSGHTANEFTDINGRALPRSNFTQLLIRDGLYDQTAGLVYNADINPPNTQYVAWYYDVSGVQIAGPTTAFTVSSASVSIPTETLTVPTAGSNPTPD
jgi:hypothetical protein